MSGLIKISRTAYFFDRYIEDIVDHNFFSSFDTNIQEFDNEYRLDIAVPGMTKKDLQLTVQDQMLLLRGIKDSYSSKLNVVKEFNSGLFQRSFTLPEDADSNKIKARCRNGLLLVSIAKKKNKSVKNIPISSSSTTTNWSVKKLIQNIKKYFK